MTAGATYYRKQSTLLVFRKPILKHCQPDATLWKRQALPSIEELKNAALLAETISIFAAWNYRTIY